MAAAATLPIQVTLPAPAPLQVTLPAPAPLQAAPVPLQAAPVPLQAAPVQDTPAPVQAAAPVQGSGSPKRVINPHNWTSFIHDIEKEVHPELKVTKDVISTVNDLLIMVAQKTVRSGDSVADYGGVITLGVKEIQTAAINVLPDSLKDIANTSAVKACDSYDPKILNPPKRQPRGAATPATPVTSNPATDSPKKVGTRSDRANLTLPIARVEKVIREVKKTQRVGEGAPVYLTGILDFLAHYMLDVAGKITLGTKVRIIRPEHLVEAIEKDLGLRELFATWLLMDNKFTDGTPADVSSPAPIQAQAQPISN